MFTGTPAGNLWLKRLGFVAFIVFYLYAGLNHLVIPGFYWPLILPIFHYAEFINISSGLLEIVLAIMLMFPGLRRLAAVAIILMLAAYLPSHIYFIQIGACIVEMNIHHSHPSNPNHHSATAHALDVVLPQLQQK